MNYKFLFFSCNCCYKFYFLHSVDHGFQEVADEKHCLSRLSYNWQVILIGTNDYVGHYIILHLLYMHLVLFDSQCWLKISSESSCIKKVGLKEEKDFCKGKKVRFSKSSILTCIIWLSLYQVIFFSGGMYQSFLINGLTASRFQRSPDRLHYTVISYYDMSIV